QRDPDFASAHAMAGWCYSLRRINRWMTDPEREVAEGMRLARDAVDRGQDDAVALAASVHPLAHLARDPQSGIAVADRALALDPNLAAGWFAGGFVRIWCGLPDDAIERLTHAMRLNPLSADVQRMEVGI